MQLLCQFQFDVEMRGDMRPQILSGGGVPVKTPFAFLCVELAFSLVRVNQLEDFL